MPNSLTPAIVTPGIDALIPSLPTGSRTIFLGDSITQGSTSQTANAFGSCWPITAAMYSGQRLLAYRIAGVAGNTTTQMLARVQSNVIAYAPAFCVIMAGTNDCGFGSGLTIAQSATNIAAMVTALRAAGIKPILCTIPPNNGAGGPLNTVASRHQQVSQLNAWIQRYCATSGLPCWDLYSILVDPVTGNYLTGFSGDGTHPNVSTQILMAQYVTGQGAYTVDRVAQAGLPDVRPYMVAGKDDFNMLSGGLFLSNTGGLGTGFYDYGDLAHATLSTQADAAILGNWQQVVGAAGATLAVIGQDISTGFSPGDRLAFSGLYESAGVVAAGASPSLKIAFNGGTGGGAQLMPISGNMLQDFSTPTPFYMEGIVNPGTTSLSLAFSCSLPSVTAKLARLTLLNLTQLGF